MKQFEFRMNYLYKTTNGEKTNYFKVVDDLSVCKDTEIIEKHDLDHTFPLAVEFLNGEVTAYRRFSESHNWVLTEIGKIEDHPEYFI